MTLIGLVAFSGFLKGFDNSRAKYREITSDIPARVWDVRNELNEIESRQPSGNVRVFVDSAERIRYENLLMEKYYYDKEPGIQLLLNERKRHMDKQVGYAGLSLVSLGVGVYGVTRLLRRGMDAD